MAEIGSAMSIGTVGSNPRGYTLLIMQVMHIPLHFSTFIFYAFSENVQLYGTVFFLKNSLFFQIFFQPQNPSKNSLVFRRVLGVGKRNMSFSKLAGGPNLADSFFQMAPDDDPDKFFCVSGSAGGAGGGSSKQMEKKKGGEDYNSEEYMEDWCGNDLSCKHTTTLSWDGLCTGTMALGWAQQAGVHDQEVEQG